ncbi:PREDICTED: putative F-box protein At5g62660 [Camelina sativa]|uniref:F-box protein At5g62660 n=1 Tax=Camelina sativa TaxID=90675 RepID=A0ABM0WYI8_CAMSA|nr:PREDICTED: putative F-box protein At5g62660 [Camelina sativa]
MRSSKVMMILRRGRKRRRSGVNWVAPEIPLDLLVEVLTRLPAKSLMRFKCVSKQWSSLIRSRYFNNRYLTVATPPRPPHLYIGFVDQDDGESVLLSFLSSSSSSGSAESFDQDLTMIGVGGTEMVALRGLILYTVCAKACIYNPTTRQSVTLPAVKYDNMFMFAEEGLTKDIRYVLGYDPVLDQYKVVCTVVIYSDDSESLTSEHWVFVLEARGFWKRIQFDRHHKPTIFGPCINGVIYYMASTDIYDHIVFSFDVRSEEFNMIQVPDVLHNFGGSLNFIEYGGKPAISNTADFKEKGLLDLWILEDAAGKWSRKPRGLQPCQMHFVDDIDYIYVEGATQIGEVILAPKPMSSPYYFSIMICKRMI